MNRPVSLTVALVLLVAACGGTADGTAATTTTTTTTTTTAGAGTSTTVGPTTPSEVVSFAAGDGTEVRFQVWEVLLGADTLVVATNRSVAVAATVDFSDLGASTVGPVTIDASAFETDQSRRNGAIRQFILQSDAHPVIVFTPTDLGDLAAALAGGTTTVTGDLTIRDVSVPVVFEVVVAEAGPSGIRAFGTATVDRTDWALTIPNVASVASVDEELLLELDLVLVPTT